MMTRTTSIFARALVALALLLPVNLWPAGDSAPKAATPAEAGVRQEGLDKLKALLEETKTRAAIVMRNGKTVAEWYWEGSDENSKFECWSTSKSYASTCVGLLIDDGKIGGIDEPVSKYIPAWSEGDKAKVKIAHLLDQTSGLEEERSFVTSPNQLEMCLNAKIITPPGETGRYNNAGCNVLSAVIWEAAKKDPEEYMRDRLWKPLGMDHTSWRRDAAKNVITYAGIQSTARDLARFGQFLLSEGKWEGKQLLSKKWIDAATHERTHLAIQGIQMEGAPYGLLWWLDFGKDAGVPHSFSSLGLWGNNMTVIPDLGIVGVRLVGNSRDGGGLMTRTPEWVKALAGVVQPPKAEAAGK